MDTKELVALMAKAFTLKQLIQTSDLLGEQGDVPGQLLDKNKINNQIWLGALAGLVMVLHSPVRDTEFKEDWNAHLERNGELATRDNLLATLNIPEQKEAARQWYIFLEPLTTTTRRTTIMQILHMAIRYKQKNT